MMSMDYHESLSLALSTELAFVVSERVINWTSFNGTEEIVAEMVAGGFPDTRAFLKPVYRVCKSICASPSVDAAADTLHQPECDMSHQERVMRADSRDPSQEAGIAKAHWLKHANFVEAVAVAEWVVALSASGDASLGIPPQPQLQPQFVFNTIVTMCQRANATLEGQATFARMCHHQLAPDVFTMTALMDVLGRSHDVDGSFWVYRRMATIHKLEPNVVTLVTASRVAILHKRDDFFYAVLEDLKKVASEGTGDDVDNEALPVGRTASSASRTPSIVLLAALECSLSSDRTDLAEVVLTQARTMNLMPDLATIGRSLGPIWATHLQVRSPIEAMITKGLLPEGALKAITDAQLLTDESETAPKATNFRQNALGRHSTSDMRREVVEHDLEKLEARLQESSVSVTSGEFETLLHQCRKRKWSTEVPLILAAMERLGAVDRGLAPSPATLLISIDAYLDGNDLSGGWTLLKEAPHRWGFATSFDPVPAYLLFCRGGIRAGEAEVAFEAVNHLVDWIAEDSVKKTLVDMVRDGCCSAGRLIRGMLRGLGKRQMDGVNLLKKLHFHTSQILVPPPEEYWLAFVALLVESCAICSNPEGSLFVLEETLMLTSQQAMILSPAVSMSIAMAAAASGMVFKDSEARISAAHNFVLRCSEFLPRLSTVNCLLEEVFQNCPNSTFKALSTRRQQRALLSDENGETRSPLPFNGFARPSLLRLLHSKHAWLRRVMCLIVGTSVAEANTAVQNQITSAVTDAKVDEEEEDEDAFIEVNLSEINGASKHLALTEAILAPFIDGLVSRKSVKGNITDSYLKTLMGTDFVSDNADKQSSLPSGSQELICLLRVQWLHVRCLAITSKETREYFVSELASSLAFNGRESAETLLLTTLACFGSLPPKLQARVAGFLASAFFQAFGAELSERNEEFALSVSLKLKEASLELLKAAHKTLIEPIGITTAAGEVLVKTTLSHLVNTPTVSTTMKSALFLKVLSPFIHDQQAIDITGQFLDLGPSSEGLEAATAFTKDTPRTLIEALSLRGDPHLTASMVCRVGLALEYEHLLLPSNTRTCINEVHDDESERNKAFLRLHDLEPVANVIHVCDLASVRSAATALAATSVVGLDCEWRPYKKWMLPNPVSFLQISTPTESFLLDLLALKPPHLSAAPSFGVETSGDSETTYSSDTSDGKSSMVIAGVECFQMVDALFQRTTCAKVGFGFGEDLRKLSDSYPDWWGALAPPQPIYDLLGGLPVDGGDGSRGSAIRGGASVSPGGLSALVEKHLGKPLDKRMQTSDWAARPLTKDQEEYAALDARCLVSLYSALF